MFNLLARKIAGIDEEALSQCPKYEKTWATHIGYMLLFTFIILFTISYLSIDYFNGTTVVLDIEDSVLKLEENSKQKDIYLFFAVGISLTIAMIIFMFDRAVYQSDWFTQLPYGVEISASKKFTIYVAKIWRIVVRLAISLAVAYSLSTFLELRIHESQILDIMQKRHLSDNREIYNNIKLYAEQKKNQQKRLIAQIAQMQKRLNQLQSEGPTIKTEYQSQVYNQHQKQEIEYYNKLQKSIKSKMQNEIAQELNKLEQIQKELDKSQAKRDKLELQLSAERDGIKSITIDGIAIEASGKSTCGKNCRLIQARIAQVDKTIRQTNKKLQTQKRLIDEIKKPYNTNLNELQKEHNSRQKEQASIYKQNIKEFVDKQKKNLKSDIQNLKESIEETQKQLTSLNKRKENDINLYTQKMMKSPEFIKFRDGPMTRMMAVEDLHNDPKYGAMMWLFSLIVKAFIMFLEVVPVVAKMFFSPPSVYGAILQKQARDGVRRFCSSR